MFTSIRAAGVVACVFATGCAGNLKLLEDGKVHMGTFNNASKTLEIKIDGVPYSGTYVQGMSVGFGSAFSGRAIGTGTMLMSDGSGQALLTSPEGKILRCVFGSVVAMRGQGQCQNNDGKVFDLLISP